MNVRILFSAGAVCVALLLAAEPALAQRGGGRGSGGGRGFSGGGARSFSGGARSFSGNRLISSSRVVCNSCQVISSSDSDRGIIAHSLSRLRRAVAWARAFMATRWATPCSQGPRGACVRITLARRTSTIKVA